MGLHDRKRVDIRGTKRGSTGTTRQSARLQGTCKSPGGKKVRRKGAGRRVAKKRELHPVEVAIDESEPEEDGEDEEEEEEVNEERLISLAFFPPNVSVSVFRGLVLPIITCGDGCGVTTGRQYPLKSGGTDHHALLKTLSISYP